MSQFSLHTSHGYSVSSDNGENARNVLDSLHNPTDISATPELIATFQAGLGLQVLRQQTIDRVIIVVGSGMNPNQDGMSTPSWARARRAVELFQKKPYNTLIVPTARFTYRLLLNEILPPSTDAREIGKFLVNSGVSAERVLLEEWSNCTLGNAVFTRLLLGSFISDVAKFTVVTSSWALERAKMVFRLLFPGRNINYETVTGDLDPSEEKIRIAQENIVNEKLYRPAFKYYGLNSGPIENRLRMALWYMRTINASTPGNTPDQFALATTQAIKQQGINPGASYGVR